MQQTYIAFLGFGSLHVVSLAAVVWQIYRLIFKKLPFDTWSLYAFQAFSMNASSFLAFAIGLRKSGDVGFLGYFLLGLFSIPFVLALMLWVAAYRPFECNPLREIVVKTASGKIDYALRRFVTYMAFLVGIYFLFNFEKPYQCSLANCVCAELFLGSRSGTFIYTSLFALLSAFPLALAIFCLLAHFLSLDEISKRGTI